jgi:hypothetical protein
MKVINYIAVWVLYSVSSLGNSACVFIKIHALSEYSFAPALPYRNTNKGFV